MVYLLFGFFIIFFVAKDDELGRKLQDLDLPVRKRITKSNATKGTDHE
jgi:hypothetical protein